MLAFGLPFGSSMSSVNKLLEDVKVIPVPVVADALIVTSVRFSSSNGWF